MGGGDRTGFGAPASMVEVVRGGVSCETRSEITIKKNNVFNLIYDYPFFFGIYRSVTVPEKTSAALEKVSLKVG